MKRGLIIIISLVVIAAIVCFGYFYRILYSPAITPGEERSEILIPGDATYSQVIDSLQSSLIIRDIRILRWVAEKKKYPSLVKPGRYVINKPVNYIELIDLLRSGKQTPVLLTFNNIRTLPELAGKLGGRIEADSSDIIDFLSDEGNYKNDGFTRLNVITVFLPDTYEFFWNTGAKGLYSRMLREYRKFWNDERSGKAEKIGLSADEVAVLASIIDFETGRGDEKPIIAGVYLNRLKRGMPLQADPTVIFANNDFSITRVLYKHLDVDSPYNTYKYKGLPPGPIGCPSIESLNAVLNAERHDYLYFVAKADFSGYHTFSKTLSEHTRNAAMFQRELNKRRIFR